MPQNYIGNPRYKAKRYSSRYVTGLSRAIDALNAWEDVVSPASRGDRFVKPTVDIISKAISDMENVAAENGIIVSGG